MFTIKLTKEIVELVFHLSCTQLLLWQRQFYYVELWHYTLGTIGNIFFFWWPASGLSFGRDSHLSMQVYVDIDISENAAKNAAITQTPNDHPGESMSGRGTQVRSSPIMAPNTVSDIPMHNAGNWNIIEMNISRLYLTFLERKSVVSANIQKGGNGIKQK